MSNYVKIEDAGFWELVKLLREYRDANKLVCPVIQIHTDGSGWVWFSPDKKAGSNFTSPNELVLILKGEYK